MEKALLSLFLILYMGLVFLRYFLERLNRKYLRAHGKVVPPVFVGEIDEATLGRMADYTYDTSVLSTKEDFFEGIVDLAVLFLLVPPMVDWLATSGIHITLQALIFFCVLAVIGGTAGLPFKLYEAFVLERKYGFSTITWKIWVSDLIKSVIISAILLAIMISAFMTFVTFLPESWWFWAWLFFTLFEIVLLWLYPVLIAPLFNKFEPVKNELLKEEIVALLDKVGLKTKGVYQVDAGKRSTHTNAYFTGIGKTKRIVLYDTLLASQPPEEIIAVLAHEIGHWKKKHIAKQLLFMIGVSLILFYLAYSAADLPVLYSAFRIHHTPIYAGLFLVALCLNTIKFYFNPVSAAFMRKYEREADDMAFRLTGTSQPMINALKRLARDNLSNLHPHPIYAWFYYSHPPLLERIAHLEAIDDRRATR